MFIQLSTTEDYDYVAVAFVLIFFKAEIIELNVCKKKKEKVISRSSFTAPSLLCFESSNGFWKFLKLCDLRLNRNWRKDENRAAF